jgi:type IV secretion system protein VirD4
MDPYTARRRERLRLVGGAIAAVALLATGALYLAGSILLWTLHLKPQNATPATFIRYAYWYGDRPPVRRRIVGSGLASTLVVGVAGLVALLPRRRSLHGDARFATRREIEEAALLSGKGIVLGRIGARYLMLPGQQGVLLSAAPRTGKGVGVVIPTGLTWEDSLVCVDIKKENFKITAGWRKEQGQYVYLVDFLDPEGRTACWNPLDYVSEDTNLRINDLQLLADSLFPDIVQSDPFWPASARSMFLAVSLYVLESGELPHTMGEILRQGMVGDDDGFGEHWKKILAHRACLGRPLSALCSRGLRDLISLAPQTLSGIRKTFTSRLDLWLNPLLDEATSRSDFDLRELRRRRVSIYVGVNPTDLSRLRPVINLFFQQAIGVQTRVLPEDDPTLRYQVLMLLDEFVALGRIPILTHSAGFVPGYNLRILEIIQSPSQIKDLYGVLGAETQAKALAVRIMYPPNNLADAEAISAELGYTTVKVHSHSRGEWGSGRPPSVTTHEVRRPLMLPQEVKEMGRDEEIIFCDGVRPIRAQKIRYYEDPFFKARLRPPPEVPSMRLPDGELHPLGSETVLGSGAPLTTGAATASRVREEIPRRPMTARKRQRVLRKRVDPAPEARSPNSGPLDPDLERAVQAFVAEQASRTPDQ